MHTSWRSRLALAALLGASTLGCTALPLRGPLLASPAVRAPQLSDTLPVRPGVGFFFERYSAPIDTNVKDLTIGPKVGRSSVIHFSDPIFTRLPLVTIGEQRRGMAVAAAAKSGQIDQIDLVEIERLSLLGIFIRETIVVRGD